MNLEIVEGAEYDFGDIILSETDIIEFAKVFDPLDFHIDKEKAAKTIFKGLIASGPHLFNLIYRKEWIPRFGKTVICGLSVSNWKFLKPVYANQKITATLLVKSIVPDVKMRGNIITWHFEFLNDKSEKMQELDMVVLHRDS